MSVGLLRSTLVGCALLLAPGSLTLAHAQAWGPLKGQGDITVTYENIYVKDHFDYRGNRFQAGPIRTNTVITTLEYGITNRLTLDADLAHVTSKYEGFVGPVPHGPPDTGFYHPTFQDARFGVRYNLFRGPVVVTPLVLVGIPTHHYETRGHTAVGRDLKEVQFGVNVGRDLEGIIPRSYVEGRYSFAVVEKVRDFNLNRSNADVEFGYSASPRITLRFTGAWQHTYGGVRIFLDQNITDYHLLHDRAAKSSFLRIGGGLSFSLTKSVDLNLDAGNTQKGTNTHAARGLSIGLTWRFSRGGFRVGKY